MDKMKDFKDVVASIVNSIKDAANDNSIEKAQYMQGLNQGLIDMNDALYQFLAEEVKDELNKLITFALLSQRKRLSKLNK